MKKRSLIPRLLNRWAHRSKMRVFVCGTDGSTCEWDSLRSSFYADLKPSVYRVFDPTEADVVALHGPLSDATLERLEELLALNPLPVVVVGCDLRVSTEGRVLTRTGAPTRISVSVQFSGHMPQPQELQSLAVQAVKDV